MKESFLKKFEAVRLSKDQMKNIVGSLGLPPLNGPAPCGWACGVNLNCGVVGQGCQISADQNSGSVMYLCDNGESITCNVFE